MNNRIVGIALVGLSLAAAAPAGAQRGASPTPEYFEYAVEKAGPVDVRTFPLQNLSNADAAKLVSPYVSGRVGGSGVFEVGGAIHAITVRATQAVLARVDSLLKATDKPKPTVVLRLQVIAASDSSIHDPAITEVDQELRSLFRFNGYRLVSQGIVTVTDDENFSTTVRGPNGDQLGVRGSVSMLSESAKAARIFVLMSRQSYQVEMGGRSTTVPTNTQSDMLSTWLSIPIGHTVIVGSASTGGSATPALILAVRPELAKP